MRDCRSYSVLHAVAVRSSSDVDFARHVYQRGGAVINGARDELAIPPVAERARRPLPMPSLVMTPNLIKRSF